MNMKILPLLLTLACSLLVGCDDDKPSKVRIEPQTSIVANQFLMDAKDLDLELILGHLKEGKDIDDPGALEQWINTTPGVNNVDLDGDGKIDLISVKEQEGQAENSSVLALLANPADGSEATVVAELQFTHKAGQVQVDAGYPEYVQGHQQHHYHVPYSPWHSPLLAAWLWAPHPYYYHPMGYYRGMGWYHPTPVLSRSSLRTTRTSTRTSVKAAPIRKATTGKSFSSKSPAATKTAAKRQTAAATSIKSGTGKSFTQRDAAKPKAKASNLKKTATAPKPRPVVRPTPRPVSRPAPRPISRPSRPSISRRR